PPLGARWYRDEPLSGDNGGQRCGRGRARRQSATGAAMTTVTRPPAGRYGPEPDARTRRRRVVLLWTLGLVGLGATVWMGRAIAAECSRAGRRGVNAAGAAAPGGSLRQERR